MKKDVLLLRFSVLVHLGPSHSLSGGLTGLTPAVRRVGAGGLGSRDGVKGWLSLVGSRVSKMAGQNRSREVEMEDVSR